MWRWFLLGPGSSVPPSLWYNIAMDYYSLKQDLALVDKQNNVIGRMDKWEAHEKGILHRAFTVALIYQDSFLLQHRKHPVFDGVYDLTCSSHPVYANDKLQTNEAAVSAALLREWGIESSSVSELRDLGSVYYQAKDPRSKYQEHEICHLIQGKITHLPASNSDFAYGFSLLNRKNLLDKKQPIRMAFAPWVPLLLDLL